MRTLKHPCRDAVAKRLKRAAGHLGATLSMIESRRPALQLVQQLAAVEAAVGVARRQVVEEQLQVCLDEGDANGPTLRQLKTLARFL